MDFRKKCIVPCGTKVNLGGIDAGFKGVHVSHQDAASPDTSKHSSIYNTASMLRESARSSSCYRASMRLERMALFDMSSVAQIHKASMWRVSNSRSRRRLNTTFYGALTGVPRRKGRS